MRHLRGAVLKRVTIIALALAILAESSGCATILTLSSERRPCKSNLIYSGTAFDYDLVTRWWAGDGGSIIALMALLAIPFGLIDLPLSLTADTMVLPATAPKQIREDRRCKSEAATETRVTPHNQPMQSVEPRSRPSHAASTSMLRPSGSA